jgi:Ca2+/Na+ antiporter
MITIIGFTLGIPDTVMGLTFIAAGVSVPDALSGVAVVKEGQKCGLKAKSKDYHAQKALSEGVLILKILVYIQSGLN